MTTITIWKYPIEITDIVEIEMPTDEHLKFLSLQEQNDASFMWWQLNPNAEKKTHTFYWIGTGHPFVSTEAQYLGTLVNIRGLPLVFHLYEAPE